MDPEASADPAVLAGSTESTVSTRSTGSTGSTGAIVVGAGSGRRLGGVDKAFLQVAGRPLLACSVAVFEHAPEVDHICLVLSEASLERGRALARERNWRKVRAVVPGGPERQDSVRAGLQALPGCEWVLVHDAARPLITRDLVRAGLRLAQQYGAAVAATPVRDTLKRVAGGAADTAGEGSVVEATVDRTGLWAAQTPQVFRAAVLRAAYEAAALHPGAYTDDAALVEATGHPVHVFPGLPENIKVTLPEDVAIAEALLRWRQGSSA